MTFPPAALATLSSGFVGVVARWPLVLVAVWVPLKLTAHPDASNIPDVPDVPEMAGPLVLVLVKFKSRLSGGMVTACHFRKRTNAAIMTAPPISTTGGIPITLFAVAVP